MWNFQLETPPLIDSRARVLTSMAINIPLATSGSIDADEVGLHLTNPHTGQYELDGDLSHYKDGGDCGVRFSANPTTEVSDFLGGILVEDILVFDFGDDIGVLELEVDSIGSSPTFGCTVSRQIENPPNGVQPDRTPVLLTDGHALGVLTMDQTLRVGQSYRCYRYPGVSFAIPFNAERGIFQCEAISVAPVPPIEGTAVARYAFGLSYRGGDTDLSTQFVRGVSQGLVWDVDLERPFRFAVGTEAYNVVEARGDEPLRYDLTLQRSRLYD